MILVRRFLGLFQDSPTYVRDRASLISGFMIGTTGLLLNAAVLILVFPILMIPSPSFQNLIAKVEFGQLLALILLGGATIFSTLLIPLRLVTVFWEPRIGRYFDQIVLSGITPLRFVIGKATSQNLFLALILFLLLPYLVLSLTLGGVNLSFFAAGLLLLWLYCMALALVTLWVSLYLNELLSAIVVIAVAGFVSIMGCIPMEFQPFVITPFPMLTYPVWGAMPDLNGVVRKDVLPVFVSCAAGTTAVIGAALFAIYLGPLYGIIRENSTFGEVVRAGDSKRKRWFRFRMHVQRSSEIAFFYENRSRAFLGYEGLIRWGIGLCGLIVLTAGTHALIVVYYWKYSPLAMSRQNNFPWWVFEFYALWLTVHGLGLALAASLFSHTKNTTYVRMAFFRGWKVEVATLDTIGFLLFLLFSTVASASIPFLIEKYLGGPNRATLFPTQLDPSYFPGREVDFARIATEGTAVISVAALIVYTFLRYVCLGYWLRSGAIATVGLLYYVVICVLPLAVALSVQIDELRRIPLLVEMAPIVCMFSPMMAIMYLFEGRLGPPFPDKMSTVPFYVFHAIFAFILVVGIRGRSRNLRPLYLAEPTREAAHG